MRVLTLERRLSLSSLLSRTRKLGGTYQKQTLVCWGYEVESKIHAQLKQASLKMSGIWKFENSKFQICSAASRYNPTFKPLITFELPDFHTIIQYLCVWERVGFILPFYMVTPSPLLLLCDGLTYLDSTFLTSKNITEKNWNGDFPGGPVSKTLRSQCRGPRFNPWLGD